MRSIGWGNHVLMFGTMFVAMFVFFSFFSVPKVEVGEIVDVTDERVLELEEIIEYKNEKIEKLELMQPPDYSSAIICSSWFLFMGACLFGWNYFEHKKDLKKMELEAKEAKK